MSLYVHGPTHPWTFLSLLLIYKILIYTSAGQTFVNIHVEFIVHTCTSYNIFIVMASLDSQYRTARLPGTQLGVYYISDESSMREGSVPPCIPLIGTPLVAVVD